VAGKATGLSLESMMQKASWIVAANCGKLRTQKVYKTFKYAKRYAETMARKGHMVAMRNTATGAWALVRV
jgi:hypothetical protein